MAFPDAIDSHYQHVKGRVATINSSRVVAGLLWAQDWPPTNVKLEAFYILALGESPIGRQGYSATIPIDQHMVQWVWIIKGTDVQAGQRARSRGDRIRTHWQMQGELVQALYPNYTEKKTWVMDGNGIWQGSSLSPQEFIFWTPATFHPKADQDSGVLYGSAAVRISNMLDQIPS